MFEQGIQQLIWGVQIAGTIKSAIELGLFDALSASPGASAEAVAQAISADERGTRILLDATAAIDLVVGESGGYRLTPTGEQYLVSKSPRYIGDLMQLLGTPVMWQGYERLAEAVRGGGTVLGEHAEVPDFTLWKRFAQHTTGVAAQGGRALTKLLSERLAASAELRVLDVACGTGLYGLTVAREFPRASLTCLDWEHVLAYTRTHAERLGVAERVTYVPGDMFNVELGGPYDLVIASHVFHHFDDQRSSMLLRRLARVTRPGGLMAVHDFMITNDPPAADPAPYLFATTMLMSTRHGDTYTVERYARLLEGAGFGAPQERTLPRMPTRFLFAERSRNE